MGATATPAKKGGGFRPMRVAGKNDQVAVIVKVAMSGSYATGGDTLTQPADKSKRGKLVCVEVLTPLVGSYYVAWDGSTTDPKIKLFTALPSTQVANATNVSTTEVMLRLTYEGGM